MLVTPPTDAPPVDLYTNAKTTYPGDPTAHLMFPTLYDRSTDQTAIAAAASSDDLGWSWISGGTFAAAGVEASVDAGCLLSGEGLVELPENRVGFTFAGYPVPHKYPRTEPLGAFAGAMWPRGRIAGLVGTDAGEFWTPPLRLHGSRLRLNLGTGESGSVTIEAQDASWQAQSGRLLDEANPIAGDRLPARVTWSDSEPIDVSDHRPVVLRFRMQCATLLGFELLP